MATQHDSSGFRIFSEGDLGHAHVLAHRALDRGDHDAGHRTLGAWLDGRVGEGSDWVHIQWHMLVFELSVGAWDSAHQRCLRHVIPAARAGADAATDAPAALWRLALAARRPVELPWDDVRSSALGRLDAPRSPYVVLHDLLALAGAGDTDSIARWLSLPRASTPTHRLLEHFARGLACLASADHSTAASAFAIALPGLPSLGGSRAQNDLYHENYRLAAHRSTANDSANEAMAVRVSGFR
jgi:hypothetical protein